MSSFSFNVQHEILSGVSNLIAHQACSVSWVLLQNQSLTIKIYHIFFPLYGSDTFKVSKKFGMYLCSVQKQFLSPPSNSMLSLSWTISGNSKSSKREQCPVSGVWPKIHLYDYRSAVSFFFSMISKFQRILLLVYIFNTRIPYWWRFKTISANFMVLSSASGLYLYHSTTLSLCVQNRASASICLCLRKSPRNLHIFFCRDFSSLFKSLKLSVVYLLGDRIQRPYRSKYH